MVADFDTAFAVGPPCSECGRGRTLSSKSSDSLSDENVAVARITKVQPSADNAEKKKPHKSSSKAVEEGTTVHTEGSKSCKSPRGSDTSRTTIKVHGDNVANNSTTSKEKARKSTKYMPPTVETVTTSDQVTRSQNSPVSSTVTEEPNLGGKTNTASDSKHVQFDAHATDTKSPNRSHVADPVVPTATNNADLFASLLEEFQSPGFQMPDIDPKDPFYAPITDEDMKQAERDATNVFLSSGMSSSPPSWGMPSTQAENTIPYFGTQYETPLPHGMPEYNTSFPYGDLSHDTSFPYVGTTARDFAFPDFGSFQYASYGEAHNSHFPATPTSHDGSPNKGTGDGRLRDRSSYRHRQRRSRNHSTYSIETLDESLHVADYSMAPAKFVLVPDSEDGKDKVMRTTDTRRRRMRRLRDSLPSLHKALSTIAEPTKAPLRYSDDDVYQSESTDDSSKIAHTGHSE